MAKEKKTLQKESAKKKAAKPYTTIKLSDLPTKGGSGNRFGIIQLSDLQFGRKHRFEDSSDFVRKLVSDTRNMSKGHNFRLHYMVLSGDISETGHEDEFNKASKVIGNLCDELNIERKKILCIPGNHDVNWNLSKKSTSNFKFLKYLVSVVKSRLGIVSEASSKEISEGQLKFKPYNNFVSIITKKNEIQSRDCYTRLIEKFPQSNSDDQADLELEILLLNSCEKEDYGNHEGFVCKEKLLKTLRSQSDKERLKIAILHHRLDTSIPDERAAITNAAEIQSILACNKYNIVLSGHVHQGLVHAYENHDGHKIIYAGCGASGVNKGEREDGIPNQYCIHVIDFDESKFQSIWRAYYPLRQTKLGLGEWDDDTSITRKPITSFLLPDMKQKQTMEPKEKTEDVPTSKHTIVSKTDRDKMKLAILNLLGGWEENG